MTEYQITFDLEYMDKQEDERTAETTVIQEAENAKEAVSELLQIYSSKMKDIHEIKSLEAESEEN
ncbi:hypothetical protein [Halococcus dombrowskii]|uniref:hypothetical protein n=1 Tax=Halococcus dombrowskii TaxID=179637 RepID=UPI0031DBE776